METPVTNRHSGVFSVARPLVCSLTAIVKPPSPANSRPLRRIRLQRTVEERRHRHITVSDQLEGGDDMELTTIRRSFHPATAMSWSAKCVSLFRAAKCCFRRASCCIACNARPTPRRPARCGHHHHVEFAIRAGILFDSAGLVTTRLWNNIAIHRSPE